MAFREPGAEGLGPPQVTSALYIVCLAAIFVLGGLIVELALYWLPLFLDWHFWPQHRGR